MAEAYIFRRGGYEGCSYGHKVYLNKDKAEYELLLAQENKHSEYYNHPADEFHWEVEALELDESELV